MAAPSSNSITVQLYTPHKGQAAIHRSKARFRVVACGRRYGKTLMCCNELTKFCLDHKNVNCAWVSPTYRQSKLAYRLIIKAMQEVIAYKSDSELRIEFLVGSSVTFASADNYDALRGAGYDFLVLDECADVQEKAWSEVLRPTLSDRKGKAIFIGTPKGRNFFYRLFQRGLDPMYPDWASFTAPTSANPYIPREEIEAAKRELPEMVYQQEYLATFLEDSAGVFTNIDACVKGQMLEPRADCDYVIGWDIAKYQDFSVISVLNCQTMHLDYWQRTNHIDYSVQVEDVCSIARRYNYAYILQDSTGVGDPVLEQVQRRGLRSDGYLFTNASKKMLIEGLVVGIQNVGLTFPDLPVLLGELRQMQYTLTPSRLISYSAPDGAHDDTVMSLALAYHAATRSRTPLTGEEESEESQPTLIEAVMNMQNDPFAYATSMGLWND